MAMTSEEAGRERIASCAQGQVSNISGWRPHHGRLFLYVSEPRAMRLAHLLEETALRLMVASSWKTTGH